MFLLFVGAYVILEGVFERLKTWLGIVNTSSDHERSVSWRALAAAIIVLLASASHSLLHDELGDLVAHQGILGTLHLLVATVRFFVRFARAAR
jgi:hypothetical protein